MRRALLLFLPAAGLALLTGCGSMGPKFDPHAGRAAIGADFTKVKPVGGIAPEWLKAPTARYHLGPGDRLEIEMMEFPETHQRCLVLPDGTLFFHTVNGLKVTGMTVEEVKAALEKALAVEYRKPQVAIILREASNERVWLLGRLKKPGAYSLDTPTTLIEALAKAGGIASARSFGTTEDLADLRHSFLIRNGKFVPIDFTKLLREGDSSQNIYLHDGDYVYLPSAQAQKAYVLGAVNQPKAVDFANDMTLLTALADAQGLAKNAYSQRVIIIRDSLSNPKVAIINFDAIVGGKARDVVLEPQDIVWVPNSPFDRLDQYLGDVFSSFARTIAANEGARAAVPSAAPVQASVGIGTTSQ
jgi:protein involved in polysaccharide export with SLBB domain/predicted small lipoprotein YifL